MLDRYTKKGMYIANFIDKRTNVAWQRIYGTYAEYLDDSRRNYPNKEYDCILYVWAWDALQQCWHYDKIEWED